jgi:hypothetical protein
MGFLSKFSKSSAEPARLPNGAFTVDVQGRIVSSTIPRWVPEKQVQAIGQHMLAVFEQARNAELQFSEVVVQYGAFKITAREMRGGAMIFLAPKSTA